MAPQTSQALALVPPDLLSLGPTQTPPVSAVFWGYDQLMTHTGLEDSGLRS